MDEWTQFTHALEQHSAFLRDFSGALHSYFENLMGEGFTRDEAFQLVRDYQQTLLGGDGNAE